jgi:hypothetical protein
MMVKQLVFKKVSLVVFVYQSYILAFFFIFAQIMMFSSRDEVAFFYLNTGADLMIEIENGKSYFHLFMAKITHRRLNHVQRDEVLKP